MDKTYTVLVSSALYTNYGIYGTAERIAQTRATVQSIRTYLPWATVVLIDNSKSEIQNDTSKELRELEDSVDFWIDNSDDEDIQYFHNNVTNYDIGKNAMECIGTKKALDYILTDPAIMEKVVLSSRVFKISGRYQLTADFDVTKFDNKETVRKYVFKTAKPSWISTAETGVDQLLETRLWSFHPEQLIDIIKIYGNIITNMIDTFNKNQYIDVEHSMAKFIPADQLVQLDNIGLTGRIAPNGVKVID